MTQLGLGNFVGYTALKEGVSCIALEVWLAILPWGGGWLCCPEESWVGYNTRNPKQPPHKKNICDINKLI